MLARRYRLRRNRDFRRVYARGRRTSSALMTLIRLGAGSPDELLVGFTVTKKIGNAVTRNRAKRILRAAFQNLLPRVVTGNRLVFLAKPSVAEGRDVDYARVAADMEQLLAQARLLRR